MKNKFHDRIFQQRRIIFNASNPDFVKQRGADVRRELMAGGPEFRATAELIEAGKAGAGKSGMIFCPHFSALNPRPAFGRGRKIYCSVNELAAAAVIHLPPMIIPAWKTTQHAGMLALH